MILLLWFFLSLFGVFMILHFRKISKKYSTGIYKNLNRISILATMWVFHNFIIQLIEHKNIILMVNRMKYIYIVSLPMFIFFLIWEYCYIRSIPKYLLRTTEVITGFFITAIITNDLHHLFQTEVNIIFKGYTIVERNNALIYWFFIVYAYSIIGASLFLIFQRLKSDLRYRRKQLKLLMVAFGFPIFANMIFLYAEEVYSSYIDYTALSFFISFTILFHAFSVDELREIQSLAQEKVLTAIETGILFIDYQGFIYDANESFLSLIEKSIEEIRGKTIHVLEEAMKTAIEQITEAPDEVVEYIQRKDERKETYALNYKKMMIDEENEIGTLITFINVSKFEEEITRLEYTNYVDALTGQYNRMYFDKIIDQYNDHKYWPLAILTADLNGLKLINDNLGHQAGDNAIIKVAELLEKTTPERAVICRMGGDEFSIIIPMYEGAMVRTLINEIQKASENIPSVMKPLISIGYAIKTEDSQKIYDIIKTSDNDMYLQKMINKNNSRFYNEMALLKVLYYRTSETNERISRLVKLSQEFGRFLKLELKEIRYLSILTQIHDIGMVLLPDKILKSSKPLTSEEKGEMKKHPQLGYDLLKDIPQFNQIVEALRSHHEWWDGSGYPGKFKGDEIPKLARILMIIESYDGMTRSRSYKSAVSIEEAIELLMKGKGTQFDPMYTEKFIQMIKQDNVI